MLTLPHFQFIYALMGAERILFSVDYPYQTLDGVKTFIDSLPVNKIVWQFPFSWYGLPGLMKKWLDEVFVHGFAHGSTAKLGGKKLILSFTTGAPEELYTVDSFFGHTIEEYLIPFETTAKLCNLELLEPVYTCGISYADRDADKLAQQKTLAREHASRLVDLLNSVVNNPEGE